ncbi:PDR/VanB family oxidoreductase [Actinospica sp.]|uniref:PDR/VanB family oxidoreductase n=1 Tax=Actinospica sp. TaxID=1872142 RepID=UPI002B9C0C2E|nr:PDR/VanB family oxidoreductase [Actinospica sp.]HWG26321.1 PDR/VanB family oxidoreductase [Actinospica sp.]
MTTNTQATSMPAVVHALTRAATDALLIELRHPDSGGRLPEARPGDHIDVRFGRHLRQYSLYSSATDGRYLICVKRERGGRGGSAALHDELRVTDIVQVSSPHNRFPPVRGTRTLLLGAGIGITPLRAMAEALWHERDRFDLWFYAPDRDSAPLLEYIATRPYADRVHLRLSTQGQSARTALPDELEHPAPDAHVYVCGPAGFMEHVRARARKAGWADEQLHQETFTLDAEASAALSEGDEFAVRVASSGETYRVPSGSSVADVLPANGVDVDLSCEQGICGACLVPVLTGIPDHRDEVLSEAERTANDRMTICCSRARTAELTLDL